MNDIAAIFHASFHPTQGNVVDWSVTDDDDLSFAGVEFSVLPSGLHQVERDTVYFSHSSYAGLAVFRRRPTQSHGHRGVRLSSFALLVRSQCPWLYLDHLNNISDTVYASAHGDLQDSDFEPARIWFQQCNPPCQRSSPERLSSPHSPTTHLPHLLRILGPSSLSLYKFVLARRRVLILTPPPVHSACILAYLAADLCLDHHLIFPSKLTDPQSPPRVLGMVSLNDLSRLQAQSATGSGWIACTTDAIFLEKPAYYDLLLDLTQSRSSTRFVRPSMHMSVPKSNGAPSYKLESIRFTWSDMKLWAEIDHILKLDDANSSSTDEPFSFMIPSNNNASVPLSVRWADALQIYEDMCLLCATAWIGSGTWRSTSRNPLYGNTSSVRWEGVEEDTPHNRAGGTRSWTRKWSSTREGEGGSGSRLRLRSLGQGVDSPRVRFVVTTPPKGIQRLSVPTSSSSSSTLPPSSEGGETLRADDEDEVTLAGVEERQKQIVQITLSLLQIFNSNTLFWLSALREILPPPSTPTSVSPGPGKGKRYQRLPSEDVRPSSGSSEEEEEDDMEVITITARDMLTLDLGILSDLDSKFVEWLAEAEGYSGPSVGRKVVVKRTWQDVLGIVFGLR